MGEARLFDLHAMAGDSPREAARGGDVPLCARLQRSHRPPCSATISEKGNELPGELIPVTASERKKNSFEGFRDLFLKAKAKTWP